MDVYKMILGSGDIGKVLKGHARNGWIFFASGVSNSQETRESEYEREVDLLLSQDKSCHLVYFSSLAALNGETRYLRHKCDMEDMVKLNFRHYSIVRIGNIDWGDNPHTLINYLRAHPNVKIKDEYRYIVSEDEFLYWVDLLPARNCEISIPGKRMKVQEVYDKYCRS